MKMLAYVLPFLISVSCSLTPDTCHNSVLNLKGYLGSKTPYRFVSSDSYKAFQFDGCSPDKIIGFIRHGTRTPSYKIIRNMKHNLPALRDSIIKALSESSASGLLCEKEREALSSWELRVENDKNEKWLSHEGEDEMVDLAERLLAGFPQLLGHHYSNTTYYFKYTATQRAEQSARHFTLGLFGRYKSSSVEFPQSLEKDPILRFYKLCDKWRTTVKKNPRASIDHLEFILGDEVTKTCQQVSKRLGFNVSLPYDDVDLMYSACSFETACNRKKTSPWCSVFSQSDFEVLQYVDDLKHFWRDGYGHEINYKIACPAIADVFTFIESESYRNATAVFYFTHSGTILKMLSHLGLYRDAMPLTADLPAAVRSTRQWRTSYIDTFASNIIFISYRCGEEKKVLTLHQERAVQLAGCPEQHLCPLPLLLSAFNQSINDCNFSHMCSLST